MNVLQIRLIGRLGNAIGQYAFARSFAEQHGMALEFEQVEGTPLWEIFEGVERRPWTIHPPGLQFDFIPPDDSPRRIEGYYQHQPAFDFMRLSRLREWFTFRPQYRIEYKPYAIAAHVRAGDYLHHPNLFAAVDVSAFDAAIAKAGYRPLDDVEWFTEENPHEYPPGIPAHLGDFQSIQNAAVIFRSNSTFSQWAAWLSPNAYPSNRVYAPEVGSRVGLLHDVPFVRGNHPSLVSPLIHKGAIHTDAHIKD